MALGRKSTSVSIIVLSGFATSSANTWINTFPTNPTHWCSPHRSVATRNSNFRRQVWYSQGFPEHARENSTLSPCDRVDPCDL